MTKSASATATGLSPFYCLKKFFEVVLAFLLQKVHPLRRRVYLLFTALKSFERSFYPFYYKKTGSLLCFKALDLIEYLEENIKPRYNDRWPDCYYQPKRI